MRFVCSLMMCLFAGPAFADPGQSYALDQDIKTRQTPVEISYQPRPGNAVPYTLKGLTVDSLASGLGYITAVAIAADGAILVADSQKNRLLRLEDRRRSGHIDSRRVIAQDFIGLTSIAIVGDMAYAADSEAIWKIPVKGGFRTEFVSLRNIARRDRNCPVLFDSETNQLLVGINGTDGMTKIIGVDLETQHANLVAKGKGVLTALAKPKKGPIWAGIDGSLVPITAGLPINTATGQKLEHTTKIAAIVLPGQYDNFSGLPLKLKDHILVAQGGGHRLPKTTSGGLNIVAVPTVFGQPQAEVVVLADGFLSKSGRTAWGRPAAMAMDVRGLYIADPESGTLWRLKKAASVARVITPTPAKKDAVQTVSKTPVQTEPESMLGSQILRGSQIETVSTITTGSHLLKEFEEKEKAKAERESKKTKKTAPKLEKSDVKHSLD